MLRPLLSACLLLLLVCVLLESTGRGQPAATSDRVYYRDKKDGQIKEVDADLKATPAGYQIISSSDKKLLATVSPADLIRVIPAEIPGFDLKTIREPANLEAKKEWEKARLIHADMARKTSNAPERVRKYFEFRIAMTSAKAADDTADETAAIAKAAEATKLLENFLTANKTGWEAWSAGSTLARLQASGVETLKDGDKQTERRTFQEASRTWGKVARAADLTPDLRLEASLQEIDTRIRSRQFAEAKVLIDEAVKTAPAGPMKDRLAIFELAQKFGDNPNPDEGIKAIDAVLTKAKDPHVQATGYGMMGELYLNAGKPRDAMWQFLWVEVVHNQNRDEVLKALVRLSDSFRLQGDEDRARSYREKVRRLRGSM